MSKVVKFFQRFIFAITICVCLSYPVILAAQYSSRHFEERSSGDSAGFLSYAGQPASMIESLSEILSEFSLTPVKGEPLLLLLSGITMFVAATTARKASDRKKSSLR